MMLAKTSKNLFDYNNIQLVASIIMNIVACLNSTKKYLVQFAYD